MGTEIQHSDEPVEVPFLPEFRDRLLCGLKTATSRSRPLPHRFTAFGAVFEVLVCMQITLDKVTRFHYEREGCQSPEEFMEIWTRIHPRKGYDLNQLVWFHLFRRIK
jgi:uncharacterized protein YqfB (UPF0267 family)